MHRPWALESLPLMRDVGLGEPHVLVVKDRRFRLLLEYRVSQIRALPTYGALLLSDVQHTLGSHISCQLRCGRTTFSAPVTGLQLLAVTSGGDTAHGCGPLQAQ